MILYFWKNVLLKITIFLINTFIINCNFKNNIKYMLQPKIKIAAFQKQIKTVKKTLKCHLYTYDKYSLIFLNVISLCCLSK